MIRTVLTTTIAAAVAAVPSAPGFAATCESLERGLYPQVWSWSSLIEAARKSALKKGEFETSAAYQARVAAAGGKLAAAEDVVVEWPLSSGFSYNADTGVAAYPTYSLNTRCTQSTLGLSEDVKAITFGKKGRYSSGAYCLSESLPATQTGKPYEATNAFGAKVLVTPMSGRTLTIFFGFGETGQEVWLDQPKYQYGKPDNLFNVNVDAGPARSLKENGIALLVFKPLHPYHFYNSYSIRPSFRNAVAGSSIEDNILVNLKCVALADPKLGKVYQVRRVAQQTTIGGSTE